MRRSEIICATAGVLALALVGAACGSGTGATSAAATTSTTPSRTVTLWVDVPLAGAAAEDGRQMLDGVRLVVAQSDYRVGDIAVQVRASDDADPATGHSDPSRAVPVRPARLPIPARSP